MANRLRRRTSDQTVLGSNPAVAAALSPWEEAQWPIGYGVGLRIIRTVLGSNPAVAAVLSPWTRLFTPIVPRRSLHISFY